MLIGCWKPNALPTSTEAVADSARVTSKPSIWYQARERSKSLTLTASGPKPVMWVVPPCVFASPEGFSTPAAGAFTAIGLTIAAVALTPLIHFLPTATLAATIIVAVLSLVDFTILRTAWTYSRADFAAVAVTILLTLGAGVEAGVMAGVALSILLHLWRSSRPHIAEVGLVPGTQHFRNILRHAVQTDPAILTLRIDESLWFANAAFLENHLLRRLADDKAVRHVILMFSAVNEVDLSALESLETINHSLSEMNVKLHLSEVKGPVMDRLKKSHFLDALTGQVFLAQYDAFISLVPDLAET